MGRRLKTFGLLAIACGALIAIGGSVWAHSEWPVSGGGYLSRAGGTLTGNFTLADDVALQCGDTPAYWIIYDSGNAQWELNSTDVDGAGADGVVFKVDDGDDVVDFTDGITTGGSVTFNDTDNITTVTIGDTAYIQANDTTGDVDFLATDGAGYINVDASTNDINIINHELDMGTRSVYSSAQVLEMCSAGAATSHSLGSGDAVCGGDFEVNGKLKLDGIQEDVGATCTPGEWAYDTGGVTDEICYCQTTNTWMCVAVAAGPAD